MSDELSKSLSHVPRLEGRQRPARTQPPVTEHAVAIRAQRRRARRLQLTRRQLFRTAVWGGLGFGLTGSLAAFLSFTWPRNVQGFGGKVVVAKELLPQAGSAPSRVVVGKFWLVQLAAGEGAHRGFGTADNGGLLVLWQRCPHLGCVVPWRQDHVLQNVTGWFLCPCHASTYTKAGVRVAGPAPRSMDTMAVAFNEDGSATVDTGAIRNGGGDNPTRAIQPGAPVALDVSEVAAG